MTTSMQLRHAVTVTSGATPESETSEYWDGDTPWATPEDVGKLESGYWLRDTRRKLTEKGYANCGATIVTEHSIVLTKRAPIGQLAVLAMAACCNQGCFLLTPRSEHDARFIYYLLTTQADKLQAMGRGSTFMELATDDLKALKLYFPPLPRQRSIAQYLDRETSKIDEMIAAKERLLEILAEKRHALITHAVTRGLNLAVPMKSSGAEWLGDIPAHWQTERAKWLFSSLHTDDNKRVFDSVIVVTDRVVLDQQLQETVYQFEHKMGVVQKVAATPATEGLGHDVTELTHVEQTEQDNHIPHRLSTREDFIVGQGDDAHSLIVQEVHRRLRCHPTVLAEIKRKVGVRRLLVSLCPCRLTIQRHLQSPELGVELLQGATGIALLEEPGNPPRAWRTACEP